MEDSIVIHSGLRSQLNELVSILDPAAPDPGWVSRIMAPLCTTLHRRLITPVADVQRRLISLLLDYDSALTDAIGQIEHIRVAADEAARGVDSLRGDSSRIMDHLAALQEDHNRLRDLIARSNPEDGSLGRSEKLWADLHRDMTALAEAVSRLDSD